MDVRDISNVFVAKNCNRTSASETLVTGSITSGVQIFQPIESDGSAAESYIQPGELLLVKPNGVNLPPYHTYTKTGVPAFKFVQRSSDGNSFFASPLIAGKTVTGYNLIPYKAASEQRTIVYGITAHDNTTYTLKIRRIGSEVRGIKEPTVKTVSYTTGVSADAEEIVDGFVAAINANFANELVIPVTASKVGATDQTLLITALPFEWELGKFKYERLKFVVELVNFTATIENNMYGDLTHNAITYPAATIGAGTYKQVAEAEYFAKKYTGANLDTPRPVKERSIVPMDASSSSTYDTVVINWENVQGDFSANVQQQGAVVIYLPTENNGDVTNQTLLLVQALDDLIVTAYGVGVALEGSLT